MSDMIRVMVFDRTDAYRCDIDPDQIMVMDYEDALNGVHALTVTTTQELAKTDRLLIRDGKGIWYEYVILGEEADHGDSDRVTHEYYCVWSLQYDMSVTFVDDMYGCGYVPGHPSVPQTAQHALEVALEGTSRWQVGTVTVTNMASASFYRRNGWEALQTVIERWGGELRATITVSVNGVVERHVDLLAHLGQEQATRRFDYGSDLTGIQRIVSDDPWPCRIVPLGKSVETENGGYTRRPDIADVNDGVMWIEDAEVAQIVRIPDGHGGWEYPTSIITNDTYEDPSELKAWALEHYTDYTRPKATYKAQVAQFVAAGMNPHGVSLGDEVAIVDRDFCEGGLRLSARVVKIKGSMLDPTDMELTIGNAMESLSHNLSSLSKRISGLEETVSNSSAYQATAAYLSNLLDRLNAEINATGGYWYMVPGLGTRTYDREVSNPAVGREATQVVEIRGGNIRIANSRKSGGDWDWKTVLQSGHILADLVTAAKLTTGYIGSAESGNFWNLDTGEFKIASTTPITSQWGNLGTIGRLYDTAGNAVRQVDIEYANGESDVEAPSSGWDTVAPVHVVGMYVWQRTKTTTANGTSYSDPVMISGRDGTSVTIRGSFDSYEELVAAHPTGSPNESYLVNGDLYVWGDNAWRNVGRIQGPAGADGEDGITVTRIEYGTSAASNISPTNWSTTAPATIEQGRWLWVNTFYNNGQIVTSKSYMGTDGEDGTSVYVQSATKADGTTTLVIADSEGHETPIVIEDGTDGINGQPGASGYVHIAWANSQDGRSGFSTSVSEGKTHVGVYTDHTEADSTDPRDYSWSLIKGESAITHSITSSPGSLVRAADGTVSPGAVTFTATSKEGDGAATAYAGRMRIQTSEDGSAWVSRYVSSSNVSSYSYAPSESVLATAKYIRAILYAAGGTTTQLDTQTVPIVTDGTDAYTVLLANESHTFAGTATAAIADSTTCEVYAYKGSTRVAATIGSVTGRPTGMTVTVTNNGTTSAGLTIAVTDKMITRSGTLDVPVTVEGQDFTLKFSFSLALVGEEGTGISSIVEQYYLSTSNQNQTGGSWKTTPPAYVSGRYYWTRSEVTWSDGSVTHTDPVLAEGLNSANSTATTAKDTADDAKSTADTAKSTADDAKNTATNVQSALDTLNTQSGVFNKLTNSGALKGLYMSGGQLYINATYLHAGIISSLNNQSFWDLENNLFQILGNDATVRVGRGDGQGNLKAGVLIDTGLHVVTEYGEVFNAQETGGVNRGQDPDTGEWVSYKHAQIKITNSHGTAGLTIKTSGLLMIPAVSMQGDGDVTISAGTDYTKTVTVGCPSSSSKIGSVYINGNSVYSGANTFHVNGRFTANVKNRVVETEHYGKRLLYCYETPEPMFGDVGSAVTDEHGECVVAIDPIFAETMRTDYAYQVFLQKCGRGELWVAEKRPDCFVVMGTPNLPFDWELKGRQVGLETERLEEADVIGMVESASTAADVVGADVGFDADNEYVQTTEDLAFQALSQEEGTEQ